MAFSTYAQVRPWASAIREAVASRTMPPWHAAPDAAHEFRNNRSLTPQQIAAIKAWVDAGAPEGEPAAALASQTPGAKWKLGTPDLILQVPGFHIPKQGPLPYSFLIVPLHFEHDTWIRAAEFRIDQRQAIHHLNAFVRAPGSSYLDGFPLNRIFLPTVADRGKKRPGERLFARREMLLGYEPGYMAAPWMDGGGKLIRAGSDLVFEMHYNPNGKEAVDHSELALYFAKEPPRYRILAIDTLRDLDLAIPPESSAYHSEAAMTLAQPARLLSLQPHMHVRGSSMIVRANYPDGRTETLIDVPHYDFNWQTTYTLAQPAELPAGTRLISLAGYDNSANNKFNPDPAATVHWGDQTTDEMHIAFLELVIDSAADPNSLLSSAPKMIGPPSAEKQ
ncbi:MAG: thiol-disulfide isomerase [Acidobacteriota bacterium]|nr:thiol-disulfide isomerase [Acidobacteriota bacterium]